MIILVGPSASGKTEISKYLCKNYNYKKFVTTTTRNKRIGEIDGIDYHFVDKTSFLHLIKEHKLIEYTLYNNNYYGTEKKNISLNTILIVDPNGLIAFNKLNDPTIITFFLNCKKEIRKQRMINRLDDEITISTRLEIDDENFSNDKIKSVNYTIDTSNIPIKDISMLINDIYVENISNLKNQ